MSATNLESKCIEAGLKMTEPRRAVLSVLSHAHDHPSVEDVYARAKKKDPSISIATVYRTLSLLDELGLVFKHDFNDTQHSRYEISTATIII